MDKKLVICGKTFRPFIRYEEIQSVIDSVAEKVNDDYRGSDDIPILLCVLNGAMMFTVEMLKRLDFPLELASVKMTSYDGMHTSGEVKETMPVTTDVKGRRVIICEDIVDTGATIEKMTNRLLELGASDVRVCTMLFKPDVYKRKVELDYVGKSIGNDFIVGFGFDYNELGRNTKDIYVIEK